MTASQPFCQWPVRSSAGQAGQGACKVNDRLSARRVPGVLLLVLLRLGAPRDAAGRAGRPDATTLGRVLAQVDQCQYGDALCAWAAARARALCPRPKRSHTPHHGASARHNNLRQPEDDLSTARQLLPHLLPNETDTCRHRAADAEPKPRPRQLSTALDDPARPARCANRSANETERGGQDSARRGRQPRLMPSRARA